MRIFYGEVKKVGISSKRGRILHPQYCLQNINSIENADALDEDSS